MDWKDIKTQADADALMRTFMGFHDSCIREVHIWTEDWVSADMSMKCSTGLDARIRLLFQRQWKDPAAIELLFEEVGRFNLVRAPDQFSVLFDATLVVQGDKIFWAANSYCRPESPDKDRFTWISAGKLRWRAVDWMGPQLHYGSGDVEIPENRCCVRSGPLDTVKE